MSRSTLGQKAEACLKLILGMRLSAVGVALQPYGFGPAVLEEGWTKLSLLTGPRAAQALVPRPTYGSLSTLYEFQTSWFGIARRVLRKSFPQMVKPLFEGIRFVRGREIILQVSLFLERLAQMEANAEPFGAGGQRALAALEKRGLTPEVIATARGLLQDLTAGLPSLTGELETARQEQEALEEMWAWYQEWAHIARVAIQSQTLLHALGLVARKARESELVIVPVLSEVATPPRLQ